MEQGRRRGGAKPQRGGARAGEGQGTALPHSPQELSPGPGDSGTAWRCRPDRAPLVQGAHLRPCSCLWRRGRPWALAMKSPSGPPDAIGA